MHDKPGRFLKDACKPSYWFVGLLLVLGLSRYIQSWSGGESHRWFLGPLAHVFVVDSRLKPMKFVVTFKDSTREILLDGQYTNTTYRHGYFLRHSIVSALTIGRALGFPGVRLWAQTYLCGPSIFRERVLNGEVPVKIGVWAVQGDDEESFRPRWEVTCTEEKAT